MNRIDAVLKAAQDHGRSRPRSLQEEVGWSEAGGCRSAIGYRLDGAFASETDTAAAERGNAMHDYYLPVFAAAMGARYEVETLYRGIPGHADLVGDDWAADLKTTTLASSKLWASDHSLLRPKRIQAHGYAAGLVDAGELPADCQVEIWVIPVDGKYPDWWAYTEPFDRSLADEGANRVEWVAAQLAAGESLPKDKPPTWCEEWCGFFGLCRTADGVLVGGDLPVIEDEESAAAVARYGEVHAQWSPLDKEKERLKSLIKGLRGVTPDGWKVTTSKPGKPGEVLDEEAIAADYAAFGLEVPMRETPGKSPSTTVTRVKEAAK